MRWINCLVQNNILRSLERKLIFLLPALVCTVAIGYLSLIDLSETPVTKMGISDKVMHGTAYFFLTLLWLFYLIFGKVSWSFSTKIAVVCVFSIVFGILIEVLQGTMTSYRTADIFDILANSTGVALAGLLTWRLKEKFNLV